MYEFQKYFNNSLPGKIIQFNSFCKAQNNKLQIYLYKSCDIPPMEVNYRL